MEIYSDIKLLRMLPNKWVVDMICGVTPPYELFDNAFVKAHFEYVDHNGSSHWKRDQLEKLNKHELIKIYKVLRLDE